MFTRSLFYLFHSPKLPPRRLVCIHLGHALRESRACLQFHMRLHLLGHLGVESSPIEKGTNFLNDSHGVKMEFGDERPDQIVPRTRLIAPDTRAQFSVSVWSCFRPAAVSL